MTDTPGDSNNNPTNPSQPPQRKPGRPPARRNYNRGPRPAGDQTAPPKAESEPLPASPAAPTLPPADSAPRPVQNNQNGQKPRGNQGGQNARGNNYNNNNRRGYNNRGPRQAPRADGEAQPGGTPPADGQSTPAQGAQGAPNPQQGGQGGQGPRRNNQNPNAQGAQNPQPRRGYNNNNNRGPRREINPLDRGPRRNQNAQGASANSSGETPPGGENRPPQTAPNGGQPQNQQRNNGQNNRPQQGQQTQQGQRRGRPPRHYPDANRGKPDGQNSDASSAERGPQSAVRDPQSNPQPQRGRPRRAQNNPKGGQGPQSPQGAQGTQRKQMRSANGDTAPGAPGAPRAPRGQGQRQNPRNANPFVYVKPPPIKTSSGIKALSQDGNYALSWWAARWIAAMENLVDGRRLSRGRSYAKDGQVLSIEEKPGGVQASVQGSRPKPYRVAIEVIPLSDREWEQVFDVLASQALFAAQLLAGEMPRNIEEAFQAAGTSLFPARLGDLHTDCSCPDWANPCKHVAATHYILAERFDEDPFLLFRLRGRTSEQILTALRERRAGSSSDEPLFEEAPVEEILPAVPLEANLGAFYNLGRSLDDFALSFKEPLIEMPVLKRLGDPNFLGQESLLATMEPVYRAVRESATEAALGEAKEEETPEA